MSSQCKITAVVYLVLSMLLTLSGCSSVNLFSANSEKKEVWADPGRNFRVKLTIDNSNSSESLSDFPILVKLNKDRIDYLKTDSRDLHFYDSDNKTELPYEVESWDESGDSFVWVKIPTIDTGSKNDYFWLYYGGSSIVDNLPAQTWNDSYWMVQHLRETEGDFLDSTKHKNNGKASGEVIRGVSFDGSVGKGIALERDGGLIDFPTYKDSGWEVFNKKLNPATDGLTIQLTLNLNNIEETPNIFGQSSKYWIKVDERVDPESGTNLPLQFTDINGMIINSMYTPENLKTYQVTLVTRPYSFNGSRVTGEYFRWYVNGEPTRGNSEEETIAKSAVSWVETSWRLGDTGSKPDGMFDEARVSRGIKSSDWIKADYLSSNDQMITYGSTENRTKDLMLTVTTPRNSDIYGSLEVLLEGMTNKPANITYTFNGGTPVSLEKGISNFSVPLIVDKANIDNTVIITAADSRKTSKMVTSTVTFKVSGALKGPEIPVIVQPGNGETAKSTTMPLKVSVSDPTNDPVNVTFYKSDVTDYNISTRVSNQIYENKDTLIFDSSKMTQTTGTESKVTQDALDAVKAADGTYYSTSSLLNYPYQRYSISIDKSTSSIDDIDVVWQGRSKDHITLYAWSTNKWVVIGQGDTVGASNGNEDFDRTVTGKLSTQMIDGTGQVEIMAVASQKDPGTPGRVPEPTEYDYSFALIGDPQYLTANYPDMLDSVTKYLADNKDRLKLKYVATVGDLVDKSGSEVQYANFSHSLKALEDANIPFGLVSGNHDIGGNNYTYFEKYFGYDRFKNYSFYNAFKDPIGYKDTLKNLWVNKDQYTNRNHYDVIDTGNEKYLFLYLGYTTGSDSNPKNAGKADYRGDPDYYSVDFKWANEVLSKPEFANYKAVILTHSYVNSAKNYVEDISKKIFQYVVTPNPNVYAVFSGHVMGNQYIAKKVNGRVIYEMVFDYQSYGRGSEGYIRLFNVDEKNNRIYVNTYSPVLNDYNYLDDKSKYEQFILPLNNAKGTTELNTDYLGLKVRTHAQIGSVNGAASGSQVSFNWSGLEKGKSYEWFATANDGFKDRLGNFINTVKSGLGRFSIDP